LIICVKLIASFLMANSLYFFWKSISNPSWAASITNPVPVDLNFRTVTARNHEKRWRVRKQYAYVIATMIGFGIITFWIASGILSFLPDSIGSHNEDGEFVTMRSSIAAFLGVAGGFFIPMRLNSYAAIKLKNRGAK
jgi:Na+/proline symporter